MAVSIDRSLERAPVGRQPPRTPLESNRAALVEIHSRLFSLFYPGPRLLSQPLVSSQRRISTKNSKIVHSARGDFIIGLY